ncbi:hypothetical protein Tco_0875822 [Tanacetum coccineum]|uniref:BCAS3 domain-containing protein n=1 Tax=Tanacetum coccineum TaxID=301880 RepID=A0ABQ5BTE2_9ASTR
MLQFVHPSGETLSPGSRCTIFRGPQNGFELRGAVVVDSAIGPRNGFHQAMRPKKIAMVLEMTKSAEKDLELNGTGEETQIENILCHEVDIRRMELLPVYEQFNSIKSGWDDSQNTYGAKVMFPGALEDSRAEATPRKDLWEGTRTSF